MKILYAAILKTVNPVKDAEVLEEHIEYLNKYIASGKIFAKGPFLDHSGGLIIYNVENMEQAIELMENDPVIIHNTRTYEMKEWRSNII